MGLRIILISLIAFTLGNRSFASHIMGGEITWVCLGGGQFQFDLVLYRDCNGLDIIDPSLNIEVWGHTTVTSITCNFLSSTDLSPNCTPVGGSPAEVDCGVGTGGGTGPGAVQKFIYRSNPINLTGTPPAGGWAFTYDSFSRNWGLTNLVSPSTYGITLWARMYSTGAVASPCTDTSPQFSQDPYMLLCSGEPFVYDPNAYDPDNDSTVYKWGTPYDQFPSGSFNPPVNPVPVPFVAGFSLSNPTPDATFNPSNVAATMDSDDGTIVFTSFTTGNFGFVQQVESYRDGQLISVVNREIQMIVISCPGYNNDPPVLTPPFAAGTSWTGTFFAGDLINFDIVIDDPEFLQDGSPQLVTMEPSGDYFGTGFTNPAAGCDYTPCATLSTGPIYTGVQGLTRTFNWQTSCDHLLDASGEQQAQQVYSFVLNVQDDYCAIPGRAYKTIKIILNNRNPIAPVNLHCLDVLDNGDVTLTWKKTTDSGGSFDAYEIWSVEDGLIATIPIIATESFTHVGAGCDLGPKNYYVVTKYGCGGGNSAPSDTLETMFLAMTDLADGRVTLDWNVMHDPMNSGDDISQEIWREFPAASWTYRKSVDYDGSFAIDTIDICSAFQSYEVRVDNSFGCTSTSNKKGALLEDIINPAIPVIQYVTIDTTNDLVDVTWNVNPSLDTYGYIINKLILGFWTPYDTVWGRLNTTYTDAGHTADVAPETYRITAFDSCETSPGVYQTSALSNPHTTIFAEIDYDICARSNKITWTPYEGWVDGIANYEVLVSVGGSPFEVVGTVTSAAYSYTHSGLYYNATYTYFVRAVAYTGGYLSYSNRLTQFTTKPSQPAFHYLSTASHTLAEEIEVKLYTDGLAAVKEYQIERMGPLDTDFATLFTIAFTGADNYDYLDTDVSPELGPYAYRINLIDTCGQIAEVTNTATTAFLAVVTQDVEMLNTLNWTAYSGFDGDIIRYDIYRGINGVFSGAPIASTIPAVRSYVDDVNAWFDSEGQFCYRVEAVEGTNSYGFKETSFSNTACATLDPLVYIPNAFMVNGANHIFLPVVHLYDYASYDLTIFNRWGERLFYTDDPNTGWDGVNHEMGGYHSEGTYIYMLKIQDRNRVDYEYRGTCTLLIAEK